MGEGLVEPIASPLACAGGGAPTDTGGAGSWAHTGEWQSAWSVKVLPPLTQVDYTQRTNQESSGTAANNDRHLRAAGHAAKYFR